MRRTCRVTRWRHKRWLLVPDRIVNTRCIQFLRVCNESTNNPVNLQPFDYLVSTDFLRTPPEETKGATLIIARVWRVLLTCIHSLHLLCIIVHVHSYFLINTEILWATNADQTHSSRYVVILNKHQDVSHNSTLIQLICRIFPFWYSKHYYNTRMSCNNLWFRY